MGYLSSWHNATCAGCVILIIIDLQINSSEMEITALKIHQSVNLISILPVETTGN